MYDINELRNDTYRHAEDPGARIPCPDCHDRPGLDIAEDQPAVAALLSYCPLCDGEGSVSKARALAVLPHCAENMRRLKELLQKHGQHMPGCEKHPRLHGEPEGAAVRRRRTAQAAAVHLRTQ